ncbi:MAG: dihydrofolate reductase [Micrococcales bacterium]|nr:dihydrofolate reductase [Micrococcales bacterium]
MTSQIGLIWAQNLDGVIGVDGGLPFHLPEDLARFKTLTMGCPVIMGRSTWQALPTRFRPLPGRLNLVLTKRLNWEAPGASLVHSVDHALAQVADAPLTWVIGGAQVFDQFLRRAHLAEVTVVNTHGAGDTYAPTFDLPWRLVGHQPADGWTTSKTGLEYRFDSWRSGPAR